MSKQSGPTNSKSAEYMAFEDVPVSQDLPHPLVFVTVGTTKFDALVSALTQEDALNALKEQGYKSLMMQIGNGTVLPNERNCKKANIQLYYYTFKNTIKEDILKADLVISHAGAGTCIEVLSEKKPLLVVVNEDLMHNHQVELAEKLSSENYLFACTCKTLVPMLKNMAVDDLKAMPEPQPNLLPEFLDNFMNLVEEKKCS